VKFPLKVIFLTKLQFLENLTKSPQGTLKITLQNFTFFFLKTKALKSIKIPQKKSFNYFTFFSFTLHKFQLQTHQKCVLLFETIEPCDNQFTFNRYKKNSDHKKCRFLWHMWVPFLWLKFHFYKYFFDTKSATDRIKNEEIIRKISNWPLHCQLDVNNFCKVILLKKKN